MGNSESADSNRTAAAAFLPGMIDFCRAVCPAGLVLPGACFGASVLSPAGMWRGRYVRPGA